jgi:hypothetical protein
VFWLSGRPNEGGFATHIRQSHECRIFAALDPAYFIPKVELKENTRLRCELVKGGKKRLPDSLT